jgi:rubrerythrin
VDAAGSAARQVGQKTGETIEMAKLNMKIFDLNTEIGVNFREIGRIVYDTHLGKETDESALKDLLKAIDDKNDEIESYRARLAEFKKSVICPVCGADCAKTDAFCKKCGAKLEN